MMERYVVRGGKQLRMGYTTGSCAAAAAKAAAWMLLTGRDLREITLLTPKGIQLQLPLEDICRTETCVSCAIRKDSGDDPDVTNGTLIYAKVSRCREPGVHIDGGAGIGRITRRGLDQPVGNAAINSVPRKMIRENVEAVLALMEESGGLSVEISAPEGEKLAKKTFNPRLGIEGGISILGTTGIVEPMSEQALVDSIRVELRQKKANGADYVLLTPGNYGSVFIQNSLHLDVSLAVQTSNFIGDALDICRELEFGGVLLLGHIGKLVKLAGGMMNTHSKYGDCRMEILAAYAGVCGHAPDTLAQILSCVACDDVLRILNAHGGYEKVLNCLIPSVVTHMKHRAGESMEVGTVLFSREYGLLGKSPNADVLIQKIVEGR